jgi:hypothetical protein
MKVTPMGATPPTTSVGAVSTATLNPGKLEAAKAIASGQTLDFNDPKASLATQNVNSLKMRTNVSPDRPIDQLSDAMATQNAISDIDGQTQGGEEETKPLSPQFAALAKQRRALQLKEREIAAREQALSEKPATEGGAISVEDLQSNPLGILQQAGVTYEQLTEAILNGDLNNPANARIRELEAKLTSLEQGIESKLTERDAQAERQVLAEMSREISRKIYESGDAFDLVREQNRHNDVLELIHRTFKETGEVLDVEEALQEVENYLQDETLRYANLPKIRNKLTPAQEAQLQTQRPQGMRTLTNRDDARPKVSRRDRALAAFYNNKT